MSGYLHDVTEFNGRLIVTVRGTDGPTQGRTVGGHAAAYSRKHGVKLTKTNVRTDWAYGFLHETEVTYKVGN